MAALSGEKLSVRLKAADICPRMAASQFSLPFVHLYYCEWSPPQPATGNVQVQLTKTRTKKRPLVRWDLRTPLSMPYYFRAGGKRRCSPVRLILQINPDWEAKVADQRKVCQRPRASHIREALAYPSKTPIFAICHELWIESDQATTVSHFLSVACAASSVLTIVIVGIPFACLPAGVMGLQTPENVRYLFTRFPQLPTISPGGGYFSAAGAGRAWCGRRVRSAWDRRRCRLAARSVGELR